MIVLDWIFRIFYMGSIVIFALIVFALLARVLIGLVWPEGLISIKKRLGFGRRGRKQRIEERDFSVQLGTLLAVVASVVFAGSQTSQLKRQIELENRPYLYVDIVPGVVDKLEALPDGSGEIWNLYLGAKLVYKNVGGIPASNVKADVRMYNDADKTNDAQRLEEWYVKEHGYFPRITTVFPDQTGQEIGLFVDAGDGATQYLISIRVSYTGEDPRKVYWYSADARYALDKGILVKVQNAMIQHGERLISMPIRKEYGVWLLQSDTDYDGVGHRKMRLVLSSLYHAASN